MAGVFRAALKRLDNRPLEAVASTLDFGQIDPGDLANRLDLKRQGTERGQKSEPLTTETTFDSVEHTIIAEIENYRRQAVDQVTRTLEAYTARIQSFDFQQARLDILTAINGAEANFITESHQGENELSQKKEAVIGATNDVESFRKKHLMTRVCHLPKSRAWILGAFVLLFVVEAGPINGALFAGGLPGGFLEGVAIAAGIAFLNVVVGFGAGLLVVRFLFYRSLLARFLASITLAAILAACVALNLGVARFRSALNTSDPDAALAAAFGISPWELFQHLHEVTGFQSYILIGVGILFHLIAMLDGFKFDDPYPFFGKYWRMKSEAEKDYTETFEALISKLTTLRDETIEDMKDASRSLAASRRLAARIAENRIGTLQRYETYLDNLERIANQLLVFYREANRAYRSSPAPPHFTSAWKFPNRSQFGTASPQMVNGAEEDAIAKRTQDDLEAGIENVSKRYVAAVTAYQRINTLLDMTHVRTIPSTS